MLKYTESSTSSGSSTIQQSSEDVKQTVDIKEIIPSSPKDGNISLTRLWEYVVRSKRIPDDLDVDAFFSAINRRLRNPEWVVRQHALRVLVDFIPLIDKEDLDTKVESILSELVRNLGHVGPAVRKGAVDALKIYLNHSKKPNSILKELISKGVECAQQNKVNSNITLGIIIATPFLINPKIIIDTIKYNINILLERIEQTIYQESVLRSLLRIKGIVGVKVFDEIIDSHKYRRVFEMLCDLYNLPEPSLNISTGDMFYATDNKHFWNDYNQNLVSSSIENSVTDCELENRGNTVEDRVILETEIKLDAGPAITMKIHEESRQNSTNEASDSEEDTTTRGIRTFKVLTDSEDDYELLRRTPRRVRFGGEIVKLRTPDSDSNHQSDDDPTLSIDTQEKSPTIEIHYKKTTKVTKKSHIPVAISAKNKVTRSEPSSPKKSKPTSKLYKSSPNLSNKIQETQEKVDGKSRIPKRNDRQESNEITRSIRIKVNNIPAREKASQENVSEKKKDVENRKVSAKTKEDVKISKDTLPPIINKRQNESSEKKLLAIEFHPKEKLPTSPTPDKNKLKSTKNTAPRRNSRDFEHYSPIPVHNEIEVFHNLTRSPERKQSSRMESDPPGDRHLTTADNVLLSHSAKLFDKQEDRRVQTADVSDKTSNKTTNNQLVFINNYNSFHVYNNSGVNRQRVDDSPIPTRDTGECLTCSSSGSDIVIEKNGYEAIGELSERILVDIQSRDDIRTKQRGLEELLKALKDPVMLESIEERLSFLLQLLFSSQKQPFLQSLSEELAQSGHLKVIPNNTEQYVAMVQTTDDIDIKFKFIDSFRFMASSLEKLASYLEEYPVLESQFEDATLLKRKGVFPYSYMSCWERLSEGQLPPIQAFHNDLSNTPISMRDYEHAQSVWREFKCQTLGEYSDLYMKTDVLLLADVFENFRESCIKNYGLDAAHYYTAPGLSWDAMLKHTSVELDTLQDVDTLMFLEKGIRGGMTQCSSRYAKANNKYMPNYDPALPSTYLMYYDINAMYSWAMSQSLPTGGLEWVEDAGNLNFHVPDDNPEGYILEVDLEYPQHIHDRQRDLPMGPTKQRSPGSAYEKMLATLYSKEKYVVHYRNLKQYLAEGIRVTKIHRALRFKQSPWLKPYIDLNTTLRQGARNEFEKNLFKLMNNAVFGKTMENVRLRRNIKIVDKWDGRYGAEALISRPNFKCSTIFNDN